MAVDLARLTVEQQAAIRLAAQRELCKVSFVDFLRFAKIRSDDPLNPGITDWKPWDYLIARAQAWQDGHDEVILKARQLGYSWLVTYYLLWSAAFKGIECGYVSLGQREARIQMLRMRVARDNLPEHIRPEGVINVDDAMFDSGGTVRALPSTEDAGISQTLGLAVMDELAFHPYGQSNYGAMSPALSAGGQFIALSTADPRLGPSGFFHDLYWSSKREETPWYAHFEPWFARPGRDDAWLARQRSVFVGMPDEFDAWYPSKDTEAFVARTGLVFPMFSKERHVRSPRVPIEQCRRVVAGVDLGGGDPTAIVILGLMNTTDVPLAGAPGLKHSHHIHQYAEFYKRGAQSIDTIAAYIKQFKVDAVMCPPEQASVWETLRTTHKLPARPADNGRKDGLELMATLYSNDRFTIDPACKDSIAEFPGYRWKESTDPHDKTRYATKTPTDNHADAHDARRYAAMEITPMMRASSVMARFSLGGKRLAKVAV